MIRALIVMFMGFTNAYNILPAKFIREAEIKHGRVAMLSSLTIPLLDNVKPETLGVNFVSSLDPSVQWTLLGLVGCSEFAQIFKAYSFPSDTNDLFKFKSNHEPGNYSFDPLNILTNKNEERLKANEKFIGRLAMIATVCEMANELGTNTPVLKMT
jgi:hypothetical protein